MSFSARRMCAISSACNNLPFYGKNSSHTEPQSLWEGIASTRKSECILQDNRLKTQLQCLTLLLPVLSAAYTIFAVF